MSEQNLTEPDTENLQAIDQHIVKLLLSNPAITDAEIAVGVGLSRQTVNKRRNSAQVKERLGVILSISEKRIRRLVALSLDHLESALGDPDPKVRMSSAQAILKLGNNLITSTPTYSGFLMGDDNRADEWIKDQT